MGDTGDGAAGRRRVERLRRAVPDGRGDGRQDDLRGVDVDIDASASDVFSNLQFGAMGLAVARKGHWGFGSDLIWMALGTTVRDTNVDVNQGAFAFYGLRELGPAADVTFGLRVNTLQGTLKFKGPDVTVSQDQTWVDPIAGVTIRTSGEVAACN